MFLCERKVSLVNVRIANRAKVIKMMVNELKLKLLFLLIDELMEVVVVTKPVFICYYLLACTTRSQCKYSFLVDVFACQFTNYRFVLHDINSVT
jgi:hypothetical protein